MNNKKLEPFQLISPIAMIFFMTMLLFLFLTSCYVPDRGNYGQKHNNPVRGPMIEAVKASCYYNYTYDDYKWYFDAWVHYPRYDFEEIIEVHVDILDSGYLVDSFPLYHNRDKYWESSWIETIETDLWCGDYYDIEFVAYDHQGNFDVFRTSPYY
jgi:hypothetical protein